MIAAALAPGVCHAGAEHVAYDHCFDLVADASLLAHFSGVLTGLTFTALTFLAARRSGTREADPASIEDTLLLFLSAFVSFAAATYLFSSAASELRPEGRVAFISFCASLALAIAFQLLLVGLARLVRHVGFQRAARFTAGLYSYGVAPVVFVYLAVTAVDSAALHVSEADAWSSPLAYGCMGLGAVLVAFVLWPGGGRGASEEVPSAGGGISIMLVSAASAAFALGATMVAAVWAEQDYTAEVGSDVYLVFVALTLIVTLMYHDCVRTYFSLPRELDAAVRRVLRGRRAGIATLAEPAPDAAGGGGDSA